MAFFWLDRILTFIFVVPPRRTPTLLHDPPGQPRDTMGNKGSRHLDSRGKKLEKDAQEIEYETGKSSCMPSLKAAWTESEKGSPFDEEYKNMNETLGDGINGSVMCVEHKATGVVYACKSLAKNKVNDLLLKDLRTEIRVLKELDHPNVAKLIETWEDDHRIYLILELARGGELYDNITDDRLRGEAQCYNEKRAAELFLSMASAINYCHGMGICHRDLKPENFMFSEDILIWMGKFWSCQIESRISLIQTTRQLK